ncbi:MAG: 3-oxoacyl-ACP synthase [Treponema sp.]|nr:3-oxoacyl-ACP synthase [Treponema sp.]
MKKRIFLSAPALVCCAGQNRNELYESCLAGYQGGLVTGELSGDGGLIPGGINPDGKYPIGIVSQELPEAHLPDQLAYTGNTKIIRIINAALEQMRPVIEKAVARYGPDKIGVCLGSCDIGSEASLLAHRASLESNACPEDILPFHSASFSTEFITHKFGLSGPAFTVAVACASGASAIVRGAELIQAGICDAVIAGGADIVTETVFAGFYALEAVSDSLTNPFSKNRKGINLGEGAAFFLLESADSGVELLGVGESADANHMTAPGTDGAGPAMAMKAALLDAGISGDQIGYVNLHGTGTELNDKAENIAMRTVFGAASSALPVSSTKPVTGHTLGAAGALEAAICWMVLSEQKGLPVHCWDGVGDDDIPFFPVGRSDNRTPSVCMSNSFGFGGCNVSLILGRTRNG